MMFTTTEKLKIKHRERDYATLRIFDDTMKIFYSPENGRNNNELKETVQINSKVTQVMTPTVNVNKHTTYRNLLHILHNRLSEA